MKLKKIFLYLFVGSITLSALIGIVILIFGNFGELEVKVLLTALDITVTSILGLACGAFLERRRLRWIPTAGISCAVISAVMWMFIIWSGWNTGDEFIKSVLSLTVAAAACAHISMLSLASLDNRFRWLRTAAHATIWSLAGILILTIWESRWMDNELVGRVVGIISILVGAVTVLTPIFHWLSSVEPTLVVIDTEIVKLKARLEELELKKAAMRTG